jgi:pimeloyl-ACP methyl ester carboxylesterase
MSRPTVYFIPGLGADYRLYNNIDIPGAEVCFLEWMEPGYCTSLEEYARNFVPLIDSSKPLALCGTSMGGMVAIELSKIVKPEKLVLISTVKTKNEFPPHLRILAKTRLHDVLNNALRPTLAAMMDVLVSWQNETERTIFLDMLNKSTPAYLRFAIDACVNWNNEVMPVNYLHLHGTLDPLFPVNKLTNVTVVEGGNHFMVYEMGAEVSTLINAFLQQK